MSFLRSLNPLLQGYIPLRAEATDSEEGTLFMNNNSQDPKILFINEVHQALFDFFVRTVELCDNDDAMLVHDLSRNIRNTKARLACIEAGLLRREQAHNSEEDV